MVLDDNSLQAHDDCLSVLDQGRRNRGGGGGHGGAVPPPPPIICTNMKKVEGFYSANTVLLITKVCHLKKKLCVPPPICMCAPQSVIASYGPVDDR